MPQPSEPVVKEVAGVNPEVGFHSQSIWTLYLNFVFEFCIWILYLNIVFVKELFAELDKEEDGIVYTKNLIIQLRALNEDMDKNLKVYIV